MARQACIFEPGVYYVEYPPDESVDFKGGNSLCMPKGAARTYANIFKGVVKRHPDYPTLTQRILGIFTYTGELEEVAKKIRYEKADAERKARLSHLKLCFEHQQEQRHSHYAKSNCDYCKAQNEIKNTKEHAAMLTKRRNKNVKS